MKLTLERTLQLPTGVLGLTGSPDGSRLFAACMDGGLHELDPASDRPTEFPGRHESYASGCVLTPDGATLISGGYDGRLLWHDVATRKLIRSVVAHDFWSWQLALSPDGRRVASVSGQYLAGGERYEPAPATAATVKLFDAATGAPGHALSHPPPVQAVAFSPDSRYVAVGNMMGDVAVWDVITGQRLAEFKTPDFTSWGIIKSPHYIGGIYSLAFSPDGDSLVVCGMGPMGDPMAGNGNQKWQRWNWRSTPPALLGTINDAERGTGLMETVKYAPDGNGFLMAGRQAQGSWNVALFGAADGKLLASLDTKSRVTSAHFSNTGQKLFLAAAVSQGPRKDGKWPSYGRIHVVEVQS